MGLRREQDEELAAHRAGRHGKSALDCVFK